MRDGENLTLFFQFNCNIKEISLGTDDQPKRLFNRNFVLIWQGQMVSQFGFQISAIALSLWIKDQFDSPSLMCAVLMVFSLSFTLLTPIGGVFADKYSRKKILVTSDMMTGVVALLVAAIMISPLKNSPLIIGFIFLAQCIFGMASALFYPAITAAIPNIVPAKDLNRANSLRLATFQLSMLIGLSLGGHFYEMFGAAVLFFINGICYLFSAFSETFIRIPQTYESQKKETKNAFVNFFREIKEGILFLVQNRGVKNLILLLSLSYFFMGPFMGLLPYFVQDILKTDSKWYGFLNAGFAGGATFGYILPSILQLSNRNRGHLVIFSFSFFGIMAGILSQLTNAWMALWVFVIAGVILSLFHVIFETIVQVITPDHMRGRVLAAFSTLMGALLPLGIGLSGIAADLTHRDVPFIFLFSGFCIFIVTAIFLYEKSSYQVLTT